MFPRCGLVFCLLILQIKKKTSGGSQAAHSSQDKSKMNFQDSLTVSAQMMKPL